MGTITKEQGLCGIFSFVSRKAFLGEGALTFSLLKGCLTGNWGNCESGKWERKQGRRDHMAVYFLIPKRLSQGMAPHKKGRLKAF